MTRTVSLLLILCVMAAPVMAARIASTAVVHNLTVFQAYPGVSLARATDELTDTCSTGYLATGQLDGSVISSVPGILCIEPGCQAWCNFIAAAQAAVPYTIKTTTFIKATPAFTQCSLDETGAPIFPPHVVTQLGTPNIRTWWPLMYEVPGTTFTLNILYGTGSLFDDDGPGGPNPPAWAHLETWIWTVSADFESLSDLLELFHELPYGRDEVPLVSDETLYDILQAKIAAAAAAFELCDFATTAMILADFELEVMDACIGASPDFPNPTGIGTGIANSLENPACCKLLVDVEYILQTSGAGQPKKG